MYISLLIILLSSIVSCQTIEKGWKGIEPLKTDKATVNKLLGTPKVDDNGYHSYTSDETFIQVNYSTAPCQDNQYNRGKYIVVKDTVLDYIVNIKKVVKLSEIKFKREKYKKDTSGDVLDIADYINEEDGVVIGIYIQEGTEYVGAIRFRPSKQNAEAFKCSESKPADKIN